MFFHDESFDMHNDNHHKTIDREMLKHYRRRSYICNVNKCYLFFSSYEQQLDHRMCHPELYCKYCNQFIGSIKQVRDHIISCGAREEPRQKRSRGQSSETVHFFPSHRKCNVTDNVMCYWFVTDNVSGHLWDIM